MTASRSFDNHVIVSHRPSSGKSRAGAEGARRGTVSGAERRAARVLCTQRETGEIVCASTFWTCIDDHIYVITACRYLQYLPSR